MMKVDMETIVFLEVAVLQVKKGRAELLQGERASRILGLMTWDLGLQKGFRGEVLLKVKYLWKKQLNFQD